MCLASCELKLRQTSIICAFGRITNTNSRAIEAHFTVNEVVVGCWASSSTIATVECERAHNIFDDFKVLSVVPIRKKYRTKVEVVWHMIRSVDYQR
jgi:hypothetical protein